MRKPRTAFTPISAPTTIASRTPRMAGSACSRGSSCGAWDRPVHRTRLQRPPVRPSVVGANLLQVGLGDQRLEGRLAVPGFPVDVTTGNVRRQPLVERGLQSIECRGGLALCELQAGQVIRRKPGFGAQLLRAVVIV